MKKTLLLKLPLLLYSFLIFYLSSLSRIKIPGEIGDKTIHFFEYAAYAFFAFLFFYKVTLYKRSLLSLITTILYGISDEVHQLFVPGRDGSIHDIIADVSGALLMLTILFLFSKFFKEKLNIFKETK